MIPEGVRLGRPLDLPPGMSEQEVLAHLSELAARNVGGRRRDHVPRAPGCTTTTCPALIDSILSRSEFLTPYTPYQPEISQGGLQVMFEYQTAISELTGLPVSNASLYEGPSAVGAAAYLAKLANGRPDVVVSRGVHPHSRGTLATLAPGYGQTVVEAPLRDGVTDPSRRSPAWSARTRRAVILQQPNFLGAVEDLEPLVAAAQGRRRAGGVRVRPAAAGAAAPARRARAWTWPWARASRWATGSTTAGPRSASSPPAEEHIRRMPGPHRRRDARRGRPPRLRADAPDARAAHPPREGDAATSAPPRC